MLKTFFSLIVVLPFLNAALAADANQTLKDLQIKLREANPKLADEFDRRLEQSQQEVKQMKRGHVIFGRIEVEGDDDPRAVVAQMIILQDGYFVDAVGAAQQPIGFRLTGYESAILIPKGPEPIEDVGTVHLKQLPPDRLCSATGRLAIESNPDAPKQNEVIINWQLPADPINTPSNGTEGISNFHHQISAKVDDDGTFSVSGLSPGKYTLYVNAPKCVHFFKEIELVEGRTNRIGVVRLEVARKMNVEYAVSKEDDFNSVDFLKTTLTANDRWRASDDVPEYGFDLLIGQKDSNLLLEYRYAPCHILDLGFAELDDELKVNLAILKANQPQKVPVVEGHVYVIFQSHWKHWILLRTTEVNSTATAN